MYLSKLDIYGFKSFAQKVNFKFTGGVSAIVGPNGCGKTNVVDAIRWVLGEQKTSVLRLEQMENIIFNGSKSRKALSMAEVVLTIQNTKNILPSEYSEVSISRRLFRDGDSNYYLNKVKCRLRDITDLFMDTGMGADSHSVIELKMVEAILSGKIEECRNLFEEAAGVTKYKVRLKEAGRKLDSVQSDLLRVEDIRQEVEKNVASLSRHASKTKRYNKLLEELNRLEVEHIKYEFHKISISLAEKVNLLNLHNIQLVKAEETLSEHRNDMEKLQSERNILDKSLKKARIKEEPG